MGREKWWNLWRQRGKDGGIIRSGAGKMVEALQAERERWWNHQKWRGKSGGIFVGREQKDYGLFGSKEAEVFES